METKLKIMINPQINSSTWMDAPISHRRKADGKPCLEYEAKLSDEHRSPIVVVAWKDAPKILKRADHSVLFIHKARTSAFRDVVSLIAYNETKIEEKPSDGRAVDIRFCWLLQNQDELVERSNITGQDVDFSMSFEEMMNIIENHAKMSVLLP